jgi:inner membrane protein
MRTWGEGHDCAGLYLEIYGNKSQGRPSAWTRLNGIIVNPVTHFLSGWAVANCVSPLERRERALVTLACVAPDVDGLGAIPDLLTRNSAHPLHWFSQYHHQLHSLAFAVVVAATCFIFSKHQWMTALLAFSSFHLHLLEDVLGSRGPDGYQWPIPYLAPFSQAAQISWSGQWGLNAWPNFAITIGFLAVTFYLARRRGFSPLEMISHRADRAFVETLRARFPA